MHKKALTLAVSSLLAANAQAGGLWLNHWGDFSSARASAGAAAGGDEAATIIHNPATANQLDSSQLFLAAGVIIPDIEFDIEQSNPIVGNDNGGDAGLNAPVATFAYVHANPDSRWRFGAYSAGLAGAGLDYNDDWVGRFQTTRVEILVLAFGATAGGEFVREGARKPFTIRKVLYSNSIAAREVAALRSRRKVGQASSR